MLGRVLLTIIAAGNAIGPYIADFNHTHIFNPNWPPHAKFHNGQTMSMGVALGLATFYFTWRGVRNKATPQQRRDDLFTAAIFGSVYGLTGLSAILYPGSKGIDPEFGEGFPQIWPFGGMVIVSWAGWLIG